MHDRKQTRLDHALQQGLNIDTFEEFCEFAKDHPADVQFELEAAGVSEGRAVHTAARTGPYTLGGQRIDRPARQYVFHLGAHREVEEALGFTAPTDRPEPTELVLAALTGCLSSVVATCALKRGLVLTHQEVRVRIPWDPAVFLHLEDPGADAQLHDQFGDLEVELIVEGDNLAEQDVAYLEESMKRSAVYNLVRRPRTCAPTVTARSTYPQPAVAAVPAVAVAS